VGALQPEATGSTSNSDSVPSAEAAVVEAGTRLFVAAAACIALAAVAAVAVVLSAAGFAAAAAPHSPWPV